MLQIHHEALIQITNPVSIVSEAFQDNPSAWLHIDTCLAKKKKKTNPHNSSNISLENESQL